MEYRTIHELVRKMEEEDTNGNTIVSKYVTINMREDIDTTDAYLNSKHISGSKDSLGRDKPFFNIVVAARNIWYRATDIDVKDIKIRAVKEKDEIKAFLATILLQQWMKEVNFGQYLNDWGLCLANHGSAISKFIEKGKDLICRVMDWNNMIVDPIDFDSNVKIEKMWFTPAQLRKEKKYNQEFVENLIKGLETRKTIAELPKDNKSRYIAVYEVHGELPSSFLDDKDNNKDIDEDTYIQQMHVVSFQANKENSSKFDDYTLFKGREKNDPLSIAHLIRKDGQTYTGGAVKHLFEAQWMVNHNKKLEKDKLDAGKNLFQTSDGNLVGQNALTDMVESQIIIHKEGGPLTRVETSPDIGGVQASKNDWQAIANQIAGISEAMQEAPKSGVAWRTIQASLQESHLLFELMRETKGLFIKQIIKTYVLPFFMKQLDTTEEISTILENYQIKEIDSRYIPNEAIRRINQKKKETILSGEIYDPGLETTDLASATQEIQSNLTGNQRFIRPSDISSVTWKSIFKDFENELDIDVTGESMDAQGAMATLTTVLQTITTNPSVLQDPNVKLVFNRILSLSGGISPLEITATQAQPMPQPQMAGAPVGGAPQLAMAASPA